MDRLPLPPGRRGWPLLGETLEFLRSPSEFVDRRRAEHGSLFSSRLLGMKMIYLLGAEANRWIFANEGELLRNRWSPAIRKLLGADCLAMLYGDAHRARRKVFAPHFRRAGMEAVVAPIEAATAEHLRRWAEAGPTTAVPRLKGLAFEIAARYIFGSTDALDLDRLSKDFDHWVAGMFVAVPLPLPGTTFGRAMAGRRRMFAEIERLVEARASGPKSATPGVIDTLLSMRDDDGKPLSTSSIVDEVQLLLFAGHDTTVTALTNVMLHLAQHPQVLARARAEQDAAAEGALTLAALRDMTVLDAVLRESMRVVPPIGGAFRELRKDAEYGGHRLPQGWTVTVAPRGAHTDPEVWSNPERFDPERWLPPRQEHKAHPFGFIAFGGGPRRCLGEHFAMIEMQVVLARLLRGYTWELADEQDLRLSALPFPRPRGGLRLTLRSRAA